MHGKRIGSLVINWIFNGQCVKKNMLKCSGLLYLFILYQRHFKCYLNGTHICNDNLHIHIFLIWLLSAAKCRSCLMISDRVQFKWCLDSNNKIIILSIPNKWNTFWLRQRSIGHSTSQWLWWWWCLFGKPFLSKHINQMLEWACSSHGQCTIWRNLMIIMYLEIAHKLL